jgi:hypothetical protein
MALDRLTQITSVGIASGITLTGVTSTTTLSATTILATSTTVGSAVTINSSGIIAGIITATSFSGNVRGNINSSGVSTFTNGPVLIGSGTSTGTASQPLQVTGGAYVSGNLGVGTISPGVPLEVNGSILGGRTDGSAYLVNRGGYSSSTVYTFYGNDTTGISNPAAGNIGFLASGLERLRIDSSGNIGIGTTIPTVKLQVSSSGNTPIINQTTGGSTSYLMLQNTGGMGYIASNNNDVIIATSANATERFRIDSSGRVTTPNQPAFTAHNINLGGSLSGNIVLNTIILNNGNHYSTVTGNFTAPVAGLYYFSFTGFTENSASGSNNISIQKNGTDVVRTFTSEAVNVYRPFATECIISLAANDTVRPNSGIQLHGNQNPVFTGFLIG